MRLWSLHPEMLDRPGLVALWREALLAQAVLAGRTRGYLAHPQLERFRADPQPLATVGAYLCAVVEEAEARGYRFDRSRILEPEALAADGGGEGRLAVTAGQLAYERAHLLAKVERRSPDLAEGLARRAVRPHPLFTVVAGAIESWERP